MDKKTREEWLRKLIGTKKKEFSGGCRKINDKELNNFDP